MNGGEANGIRLTGAPRSECRSFASFFNNNAVCRQVVPTLNRIEAPQRMSDMLQGLLQKTICVGRSQYHLR